MKRPYTQTVHHLGNVPTPAAVEDHGELTGLLDDDHPQYLTEARGDARYAEVDSGVTDHGALTGLGDDDHPQYLTEARGDARYADIDSGVTPGGADTQVQFNDVGAFGGSTGFTFNETNLSVDLGGGTVTADDPVLNLAQTWNNAAITFTGIKLDVTNTASAATSLLMDLKVGGVSTATIGRAGEFVITNPGTSTGSLAIGASATSGMVRSGNTTTIRASTVPVLAVSSTPAVTTVSNGHFGFASTSNPAGTIDVQLYRDGAAGALALRNLTNAQTFRVYNTWTDASNYERGFVRWNANVLEIGAEAGGTGVLRNLNLIAPEASIGSSRFQDGYVGLFENAAAARVPTLTARSILINTSEGAWIFHRANGRFGWTAAGVNADVSATPDTALSRNAAAVVEVNNGTAGTFGDVKVRQVITAPLTVATLPAAATAGAGARAFVTDATATIFLSTVAGGGANKVPVVSDGTDWLIG